MKLRAIIIFLLPVLLAVLGTTVTLAATVVVPDDYSTIQQAIDAVSAGDIVYVRAGIYYENLTIGKALTLRGEDRDATVIDGSGSGSVIYASVDYVTVEGLTVANGDQGIELIANYTIDHFTIRDAVITGTTTAFYAPHNNSSSYHTIENCIFSHNASCSYAHQFGYSVIRNCEVFENGGGFSVGWGSYTTISGNNIYNNTGTAIHIDSGTNNTIEDNNIYDNGGCALSVGYVGNNNTFRNNIIRNNAAGACMGGPSVHSNRIYGNQFIYNTTQGIDAEGDNIWDNGYPSGGNLWSDYVGADLYSGASQDIPGSDGFGDTPHGVGVAGIDHYPIFNPWFMVLNQVSLVPAEDITTCSTNLSYTFHIEQPTIPQEIRGYNIQFQIDPLVVTTSTGAFTEGPYLDAMGDGQFFVVDNGGGIYTVSCAILGGSVGATGAGLFTVEFTPVAEGTSAITILSLMVRDLDNAPLSAGGADGSMQVDCTGPTMEPIAEAEGVCYNVTPTFANFGFDDDQALDWAEFQIDSDGWVTIFTGINVPEWNDDGWALPGFAGLSEGSHTVYFRVADMAGNENGEGTPDTYSWMFTKDTVAPAAPTGFTAMPGHNKVHLAWTNPVGDASFVGVEIRLVAWGDYPEYITPPSYPADNLDGVFVTQETGESYDDDPRAPRDIYYYAAFAYDCAGNYSVFDAGAADRSTSYWLGDIANGPTWDGYVNLTDLVDFSLTFGVSEGGGGWIAEADFGPTDDWSRFGIPLPDDVVDFEDLMIFSMNYGNVDPAGFDFAPEEKSVENLENMVAFELVPATTDAGTVFSVIMNSRATTLKGARLLVETGDGCEIVTITKGDVLVKRGDVFLGQIPRRDGMEICFSALGVDRPLAGSGEVAKILVKGGGTINVSLAEAEIRDIENRQFVLEGTGSINGPDIPMADALNQNFPNPFNPATTVAFDLAKSATVRIGIYDVSGRLVSTLVNRSMEAGSHEIGWNGTNNAGIGVPSGMYFYRMTTSDGFTATRKMILLR